MPMALTVSISINGHAIYTRTVVNRVAECGYYISDDGSRIQHNPADGAIALAIKALEQVIDDPDTEVDRIRWRGQ